MSSVINVREEKIALIEGLPYGKGALILPNAALQREIQKRHMVECLTMDTLAEKLFDTIGEYKGYRALSNRAQEFIIRHLLDKYGDALLYFAPLKDKKGFARELLALFTEFRRAGIWDGEDLKKCLDKWQENDEDAPRQKNSDICQFFHLYIRYLQEKNLYDLEGRYMLVIEALKQGRVQVPYEKLVMSDFDLLNPLEEELAFRLGLCNRGEYGVPEKVEFVLPKKTEFRYYASHQDEIVGIYQEIGEKVRSGAKYGDFLIVVNRLQDFPGARHLADRLGIPVTIPRTDKVSQHPIMQGLEENLGSGATVAEYVANLQNYLQNEDAKKALGRQYVKGTIDLVELKNYFAVAARLGQVLQGLVETARVCPFMDENLTGGKFWQYLEDALENESYTITQGDEDGVMLTTFVSAIGFPHKYLYVAGLNEEEFPSKFRENWIYSDRERKCFRSDMGIELPVVMTHYREAGYLFAKMLAMGQEEVYFSWTRADNMDRSAYVDMLEQKLQQEGQQVAEKDLRAGNYHRVLNITEDEALLRDLSRCDEERSRPDSSFNGYIGMDWGSEPIRMNSSKLKTYVECPFRYLVQYIWNREISYDAETAIDSLDKGNFVHRVIARYFDELQPQGLANEQEGLLRICAAEAQALLQDDEKRYKDYRGKELKLFEEEIRELTEKLVEWYHYEKGERQANMQNLANEKPFGNNREGGVELFAGLPHKVVFAGRIDHIDEIRMQDGSRRYYVTDYKTGALPGGEANVQIPIYIQALALEHPDALIGGSYFGFKEMVREKFYPAPRTKLQDLCVKKDDYRSKKKDFSFAEKFREQEKKFDLDGKVRPKLEELIKGNFAPGGKNICRYCPIKSVCRKGAGEEK